MKDQSKILFFHNQTIPWAENNNNIWLASTLKLHRNIAKFKFPCKLDAEGRNQIISLIDGSAIQNKALSEALLIRAKDMDPLEKELLYEHFLGSDAFHHAYSGEAFIIDRSGLFLASINIHDHLHLQLTNCNGELENSWNQLVNIETKIGETLDYAFNPKFGFLSTSPDNCGTGLIVKIFLHIPTLIFTSQTEKLLEDKEKNSIISSDLQGNKKEFVADIMILQNNCTLGLTSEDIISSLHSTAMRFIVAEKSARAKVKQENSSLMRDKISRAFGLLTHSYRLEAKEALNAISMCKLGMDLGWISGTNHEIFNKLFFFSRRAHLQIPSHYSSEELPQVRSEFIRSSLKDAQLNLMSS